MAEEVKPEPGAPIAKDAIDPELIKLARTKIRIGVITAAVITVLCIVFVVRLGPDRRFGGRATDQAEAVTPSEILAGNVDLDRYVSLDAEPVMSHAVRVATAKGREGLRVVPIRGTGERLWLVTSGDATQPGVTRVLGRLRKLADLPFATAVRDYSIENPRPVFATPAAVRAGIAANKVTTVGGDAVDLAPTDAVAFDVVDPAAASLVVVFDEWQPDVAAWTAKLAAARIPATLVSSDDNGAHYTVSAPDAVLATTAALESAELYAARVDSVTRHYQTTWSALAKSPPTGYVVDGVTIPEAQLDLVGLYVARGIPDDAYALIDGERPDDYWYVLPISIGLGVVGLLFAWALVRAVRRDLLPPRA